MYRLCKAFVKILMYAVFRVKMVGTENIPAEGGVLFCFNHSSLWDVPFCGSLMPRKLHFMAKSELFHNPLAGAFLRWTGAFPVHRGKSDIGSIKTALSLLEEGKAVTIFPEGKRVLPASPQVRAKAGAGMIAVKSGCPVIPVGITGKGYRIFSRKEIHVGKPLLFKGAEDSVTEFHRISDQIMSEIRTLADECDSL